MDFRRRIIFMIFFAYLQMELHSAVKIKITPKKFKDDEDTTVKVECSLDSQEAQATEISMMKIARKGERAMVILYANNSISYVSANEDEVTGDGKIETPDTNIMRSYLNMVILDPETEDSGSYICHVTYVMPSGTSMESKANSLLTVLDPEVKNLNLKVTELLEKVKQEETQLKQMGDKEKKDKSKVTDLEVKAKKQDNEITDLMNKENQVETKVTELEEKTEKQLKKIQELTDKEDTEVKSLKSTITNLMDKIKKDEDEIQQIGKKEAEDKAKVTDLEEKTNEQNKELTELAEKEQKVENKVSELATNAEMALKKVQELAQKEATDKTKVADLEGKANEQTKKLNDLASKESEAETRMVELEAKVERFITKVNELKANRGTGNTGNQGGGGGGGAGGTWKPPPPRKANTMVAFSATNQNQFIKIHKGMKLVFPDIVMQAGKVNAYNENTGVFTTPVDGLYHFTLTIKVNCISCYVRVDILANKRPIFRLKVGVIYDDPQNSASSVVQLKKGDTVKAMVDYSTQGAVLTPARLCLFSGYLITPV